MITLTILLLLFISNKKNHTDKEILTRDIVILTLGVVIEIGSLSQNIIIKTITVILISIIVLLEIHIICRYK